MAKKHDKKEHKHKHHKSHTHEEELSGFQKFIAGSIEFVKAHKIKLVAGLVSFVVILASVIAFAIVYDMTEQKSITAYHNIMDEYEKQLNDLYQDQSAEPEIVASKAKDLSKETSQKVMSLAKGTQWGYVKKYASYIAAGMLYRAEDFSGAKELYDLFIKKNRNNDLVPLAMLQSALCSEWLGNTDDAFNTYKLLEQDYQDSGLMGTILYSLARIYEERKQVDKAKEYLNRVVAEYPSSNYAKQAKKRLMLVSYEPVKSE